MKITYDKEKIEKIIHDLSCITGLSFAFYDTEEIPGCICTREKEDDEFCLRIHETEEGQKRCQCSDIQLIQLCRAKGEAVSHICHAGICDTAVPVTKNGITAGFIIIGRVRTNEILENTDKRLDWLGDSQKEIERRYKRLSYLSEEKLASLKRLISNLLFESAVRIDHDSVIAGAVAYIDNNLQNDLSVNTLCQVLFISKNRLYKAFKSTFNCTVNEYITNERINRSKELFTSTSSTSRQISDAVGINNYTYFSKLFKKSTGLSPSEYRKRVRKAFL